MTLAFRSSAAALAAILLLAACSSSPSGEGSQAASQPASGEASAPAGSTPAVAVGEPCSFLTAQEVGAIVGTTPVEVAERVGRGDCDYWLTAAKDAKVNIGVFSGPDNTGLFEMTKGIGLPEAVEGVGEDAYTIFNADIGTLVVARQGDATILVQVFTPDTDTADQLSQATELAQAVIANL